MKTRTNTSIVLLAATLLIGGCATNEPSQIQREETKVVHEELPGEDYQRVSNTEVEQEVNKDSVEVEVERDEAVERPGKEDYTSSTRIVVEAEDGDIDASQSFDVHKAERGPDEKLVVTTVNVVKRAPRMVHFPYNKATLDKRDKKILRANAEWLRQHPKAQIVIEGHTDERGPKGYNHELAHERAEAVEDYLDKLGIDTDRLQIVGIGEGEPMVKGDSERAYLLNRRVELERASNN